jgi:FMNH2-dependent dimethyl sulfone monooxygenase
MQFGYWLPVFGGWLRNVEDENMQTDWNYVKRLARRSEAIGFDLTLIAELFLNDIKGEEAPSLDAWYVQLFTTQPSWLSRLPTSLTLATAAFH